MCVCQRWWVAILVLASMLGLLGCSDNCAEKDPPLQAQPSFSCSVTQGFHYDRQRLSICGYLTALTIDGSVLPADLTVTNPLNPSATQEVVGVVAVAFWQGGVRDPLYFGAHVSAANKDRLRLLTQSPVADRPVTFRFAVYAYDSVAKTYFPCFSDTGAVLSGLTYQRYPDPALAIDPEPSAVVANPENYVMFIAIKPANVAQKLNLATGVNNRLTRAWGISSGYSKR